MCFNLHKYGDNIMCDLTKPHFQDPDKAREYLEDLRWDGEPICPHCNNNEAWPIKGGRKGLYKCASPSCRKQFTVTIGTVFENSRVPLNKWLMAVYIMASSKKGVSSKQLERTLGVTYKTAWFMSHRIREAMKDVNGGLFGTGGGFVEVDEAYIGKKKTARKGRLRGTEAYKAKIQVLSLVDRETGRARSIVVDDLSVKTLLPIVVENVSENATVMTNMAYDYGKAKKHFKDHKSVNHGLKEYVNAEDNEIHTNTIEGFFSVFKRGMKGIYQHCSQDHLQRYMSEFDFRYNTREKLGYDDAMRADLILKGIQGKRLTYNPIS
tara:strand:- start:1911 stop:2876 length:966 start_codon:yes stop_codon:yes gene_type:complete